MILLIQLLINGIVEGALYALMAQGFAIIYRGARVFHIAHGSIYIAGAYSLFSFYNLLHLPLIMSIFFTLLLVTLIGILCEILVYSRLAKRQASGSVFIIASLAIYIIIINSIALFFGNETQIVFKEISKSYALGEIIVTKIQILQFLFASLSLVFVLIFLTRTRFGMSLKALANNPLLSLALGLDIKVLRIIIFAIGSLLCGITAILISIDVGIDPWSGMSMLLSGAVAMIIGGVNKWEGPILGGFFLGIVQALAVWQISARWQDVVTFALFIIFLFFRPQGILGLKLRMEEV